MMQFYMGDLLIIGITKGNVGKLQEGQPVYFDVKGHEPVKKIAIVYGESKPAILEEMERTMKTKMPHWMWESARKDPS